MSKKVIANIRLKFHCFVDFLHELEKINATIFANKDMSSVRSYKLLVDGFTNRLKGLFFLLNLNYSDEDTLITINYQNCDGVNILLRGAIESVAVMRILLEKNEDCLYESFLNQTELDKKDIVTKFNGTSKYFSKFSNEDLLAYNRYEWIKHIAIY